MVKDLLNINNQYAYRSEKNEVCWSKFGWWEFVIDKPQEQDGGYK